VPVMSTRLVASNTSPSCFGISDQFIHLIRLMLLCDNTDCSITLTIGALASGGHTM
jgi:hypothetical protein